MREGYTKLTKEEFRNFEFYVQENNYKLNKEKVAYEVRWGDEDFFDVKLIEGSLTTLKNILNKIDEEGLTR